MFSNRHVFKYSHFKALLMDIEKIVAKACQGTKDRILFRDLRTRRDKGLQTIDELGYLDGDLKKRWRKGINLAYYRRAFLRGTGNALILAGFGQATYGLPYVAASLLGGASLCIADYLLNN